MHDMIGFDIGATMARARQAFASGLIGQADILCRAVIRRVPRHEAAGKLMREIAAAIGLEQGPPRDGLSRYHLILSWRTGFWADVNHALAQIFIAKLAGRKPLVYWGAGCRFVDDPADNAWTDFFEAPDVPTLDDLRAEDFDYFPSTRHCGNLVEPAASRTRGPAARVPAIAFLTRRERVTVADFQSLVVDVMAWTMPRQEPQAIYRKLAAQHLRPVAELRDTVARFKTEWLGDEPYLAVHLRGSDKYVEQQGIEKINDAYFRIVDQQLDQIAGPLFLMTDSVPWLERFKVRYGPRLVYCNCQRSADRTGVHFSQAPSRYQLGREVLLDSLIAAGAERFIGNGSSATSQAVVILKEWPKGTCMLFGNASWFDPNSSLFGPQFLLSD